MKIKWIKYVLIFPVFLSVSLSRYPLALIAVLFQQNYKLQFPFRWLDTLDNDLTGDGGWKEEHLNGDDPTKYWNMVKWLWRNGGHTFNYRVIGTQNTNAPLFRKFYWIPVLHKYLEIFIGWNVKGMQQGFAKYVFSIRLKSNLPQGWKL